MFAKSVLSILLVISFLIPTHALGQAAQAGQESAGQNNMAMIGSLIGAGIMLMQCMGEPPCEACCLMAAQALMQALASMSADDQATDAAKQMSVAAPADPPKADTYGPGKPAVTQEIQRIKDGLKAAGVTVENGTVTTADGKQYALNSNTATGSALAALGFSGSQVAQAVKAIGQANGETGARSLAGNIRIGAAGDTGGPAVVPGLGSNAKPAAAPAGRLAIHTALVNEAQASVKGRDPASIDGLFRRTSEDPIGLATENLFWMVKRRYIREDVTDGFKKD